MSTLSELRLVATALVAGKRPTRQGIEELAASWLAQNPEPKQLPSLTRRQQEVFEFIRETNITRSTSPTVREIGARFGIRSPNGVVCHLRALAKKGVVVHTENVSRGLRIVDSYR